MTLRSRLDLRRRCGVALTLLYLLVVGLAPLAHAWEENGPATAQAHLHAPGHDCAPPHDDDHCPACQFAGLRTLSGTPLRLAEHPAQRVPCRLAADAFPAPRRSVLTRGPRAPPAA